MRTFIRFIIDGLRAGFTGGRLFWSWILFLVILLAITGWNYTDQWQHGLVITGMSDQVSWGFYIANFAFFVGIAAVLAHGSVGSPVYRLCLCRRSGADDNCVTGRSPPYRFSNQAIRYRNFSADHGGIDANQYLFCSRRTVY